MGQAQLAHQVVERRGGDLGVAGSSRRLERLEVGAREQGVVVQHLLEVRDEPDRVDRVAVEAAGELVVDASGCHAVERQLGHSQRLRAARLPVHAEQEPERARGRELRGAAEPASALVELASKGQERVRQQAVGELLPGARLRTSPQRVGELRGLPLDVGPALAIGLGHSLEHA